MFDGSAATKKGRRKTFPWVVPTSVAFAYNTDYQAFALEHKP